ncbi:MAG: DUF1501 domain-containing protein [Planctomycetes bacterium]|nr:DUF1501 domain-containing protein [Planctomycetota bacterium]
MVLPHQLVHRTGRVIPGQFGGLLGARWDPFPIEAASKCMDAYGACPLCFHFERGANAHTAQPVFMAPSLALPEGLDPARVARRLELLAMVERQQRAIERDAAVLSLGRFREQAASVLADPRTRRAFDVLDSDPRTLERYGQNQFGWSLLMARRLVERGVSLVQVNGDPRDRTVAGRDGQAAPGVRRGADRGGPLKLGSLQAVGGRPMRIVRTAHSS